MFGPTDKGLNVLDIAETARWPTPSGTRRGSVLLNVFPKGVGDATRVVGDASGGEGDVAGPSAFRVLA